MLKCAKRFPDPPRPLAILPLSFAIKSRIVAAAPAQRRPAEPRLHNAFLQALSRLQCVQHRPPPDHRLDASDLGGAAFNAWSVSVTASTCHNQHCCLLRNVVIDVTNSLQGQWRIAFLRNINLRLMSD
jgi:hypothetical protein